MKRSEIVNRLNVIIGDLNEILNAMEENGRRRDDIHPAEYNAVVSVVERLNDLDGLMTADE